MAGNRNSGRRRDNKGLKLLKAGKRRKIPHSPAKFPYCPKNLDPQARAEWNRLASAVKSLHIEGLDAYSKPAIKALVQLDVIMSQAYAAVRADLSNEQAWRVFREANTLLARWAPAFGLTPATRGNVEDAAKENTADDFERLLQSAPKVG